MVILNATKSVVTVTVELEKVKLVVKFVARGKRGQETILGIYSDL